MNHTLRSHSGSTCEYAVWKGGILRARHYLLPVNKWRLGCVVQRTVQKEELARLVWKLLLGWQQRLNALLKKAVIVRPSDLNAVPRPRRRNPTGQKIRRIRLRLPV